MERQPDIQELVEAALQSGRSVDEVCRGAPDLAEEVRWRLGRVRDVDRQIDSLFPTPGPESLHGLGRVFARSGSGSLPSIKGYVIEHPLGMGGLGIVYKARHLALDRPVAVKMLLLGPYATPDEINGLLREARSVAGARHPNIVQVHDAGEVDGLPYFTMEFMDGGALSEQLAGVPRPPRDAAQLVATLAAAVQAAHEAGVVHRDLKPGNVLLAADGTPKIADFGLARRMEDPAITLSGSRAGTPSYMAPEQVFGGEGAHTRGVDIYALGALLYELLTGRPPFRAATPVETQRQVVSDEPVPPVRLNSRVPRDLETVCLKCLSKDSRRRYATASALTDDLHRFLRGEPVVARRAGPLERAGKWVRRHPARAVAWLCGGVAIAVILASCTWEASQRAAIDRAVTEDFTEVVRLEKASDWRSARNMLERAKTRLAAGGRAGALKERAGEIERELDLVDRLGAMRFERGASQAVEFDPASWWNRYRAAFAGGGLLRDGDTPGAFAERIRQSSARTSLIDAMDDWSICSPDRKGLEWLLNTTRLADPPPAGSDWRERARDPAVWKDPGSLAALARETPVESESVSLMLIVAGRLLDSAPDESVRLLRRVQAAHPSDFWANFALAESLDMKHDPDVIAFYRAAIAVRPEASAAHFNLGEALMNQGRVNESVDSLQRAVSLDPHNWKPHHNLAIALGRAARFQESLEHARTAASMNPEGPYTQEILGHSLKALGRYAEASEAYRRAISLAPPGSGQRAKFERSLARCEEAAGSGSPSGDSSPP